MDNSTNDLITSLEAVQTAMEKAKARNMYKFSEQMEGAKNLIGTWIDGIWEESRNGDAS